MNTTFRNGAEAPGNARLGVFLRWCRSRVQPEDVGLPRGRRRRAKGLRREEVALLTGVSVTWYTWLEQGRADRASEETLGALATALRLTPAERRHLFLLALGRVPPEAADVTPDVPEAVHRLLARMAGVPAFAMGPRWELLASNRAADAVFGLDQLLARERNMLWYLFTHPIPRKRIVGWTERARHAVAQFRADTALLTGDPVVTSLVERIGAASPEFAAWWPSHDVLGPVACRKEIVHPDVGRLVFEHSTLSVSDAPGIRLAFYAPLADAHTEEKVGRLVAFQS